MRVIIVDDEPKIRNGLKKILESQDFLEVIGVYEDAHSALLDTYGKRIDVMITDIKMPGESGLDLIRKIRDEKRELKIIILSGYGNFSYAQKAIELGVDRFFLKPTKIKEILNYLITLHREKMQYTKEVVPVEEVSGNNILVKKARQYIHTHYDDKIILKDIAESLKISPNYLCELFKKHTGENIKDYIIRYKLKKACLYLDDISYQISEISKMVGYKEPKYFSSAFKKLYGITPFEYRNREQQRDDS